MSLHGRRARLLLEYEKLINLEKRSDFIEIKPIDVIEGMPPENYVITFKCRGISGLEEDKSPKIAEFHQVSMKLSSNFPNQEPYLKWITPIWHPNIEHKEPNHVCTNNVQTWYAGKSLDDLVVKLGEMVQYQHYYAKWKEPYPVDKEVADWVVNVAEPNGWLGPEKPIDERQILRPQKTRLRGSALPPPIPKPTRTTGRLKLGVKRITEERIVLNSSENLKQYVTQETKNSEPSVGVDSQKQNKVETSTPVRRQGITLGLKTKEVKCIRCYTTFKAPNTLNEDDLEFFCEECRELPHFSAQTSK